MSGPRLAVRPGWRPALAAAVLSVVTALAAVGDSLGAGLRTGAGPLWWLAPSAVAGAVALLLAGLSIGSDRLVGIASLPMLVGAGERLDSIDQALSGRPLIVGCLWFVTLELAWASIERRDDVARPPAVDRQRVYEVALVVVVTVVVGVVAILVVPLAPPRTLLVRGMILALVLVLMAEVVRRLRLPADPDDGVLPTQ